MAIEELVLTSDLPDVILVPRDEERFSNIALSQSGCLGADRYHYEIFNGKYLVVQKVGGLPACREYELLISILDPKPGRKIELAWRYILASLLFSVVAAMAFSTDFIPAANLNGPAAAACALLSLVLAGRHSRNLYVFYSRNGGIPLVAFLNRRGRRSALMKFINTLELYIRESSENKEYSSNREILNTELREHRRLMEEGTITRKQYSRAKSRILGRHR
jgi:hypothetical protein